MVFRYLIKKMTPVSRSISTSPIRRSHEDTTGVFGSNLFFPTHNRTVLLGLFAFYYFTGTAAPVLILRHLILQSSA